MKTRISDLTVHEIIRYLKVIDDSEGALEIQKFLDENPDLGDIKISELDESPKLARAKWRGTEHSFGYFGPEQKGIVPIRYAGTIEPEKDLIGKKVNILLGGLFTMNYPGAGRHNVLMSFEINHAHDSDSTKKQTIQFQQRFLSKEKQGAGGMGNSIFRGLNVPSQGLEFWVKTVNVSNNRDEGALKVLESDAVRLGLDLVNASIPTLSSLTNIGEALLNMVLTKNRNKIVQEFSLGLNFVEGTSPVAKLRRGTYIAAQVKMDEINWDQWVFDSSIGIIRHSEDSDQRLPYNHIIFVVNSFQ